MSDVLCSHSSRITPVKLDVHTPPIRVVPEIVEGIALGLSRLSRIRSVMSRLQY